MKLQILNQVQDDEPEFRMTLFSVIPAFEPESVYRLNFGK